MILTLLLILALLLFVAAAWYNDKNPYRWRCPRCVRFRVRTNDHPVFLQIIENHNQVFHRHR